MIYPFVSIVVPVYNAQATLARCIQSVLEQTFKNFELILVDDGSKDRSLLICEKFKEKDSRIIVQHIENHGVGAARNIGIMNSKGKWITFIDADDWIEREYLENFRLNSSSADTFYLQFSYRDEPNSLYVQERWPNNSFKCTPKQLLFFSKFLFKQSASPYAKLYNRQVIIENCIFFPEGTSLFEDLLFNLNYIKQCETVFFFKEVAYHYMINPDVLSLVKKTKTVEEVLNTFDYFISVSCALSQKMGITRKDLSFLEWILFKHLFKSLFCSCDFASNKEIKCFFKKHHNYFLHSELKIKLGLTFCKLCPDIITYIMGRLIRFCKI